MNRDENPHKQRHRHDRHRHRFANHGFNSCCRNARNAAAQSSLTARQNEWRRIEVKSIQRWHNEMRSRYFCPNGGLISSAAEGLIALRRGGHPAILNAERAR